MPEFMDPFTLSLFDPDAVILVSLYRDVMTFSLSAARDGFKAYENVRVLDARISTGITLSGKLKEVLVVCQ